jgi:glycogen phosphorylase
LQCNPSLSSLITDTLKIDRNVWLKDLYKLQGLLAHVDDPEFQTRWAAVKHQNKERLALFVERQFGIKVDAHALFDVQIKRLHEYKRQTLNILGVIHVCTKHFSGLDAGSLHNSRAEVLADKGYDSRAAQESRKEGGTLCRQSSAWMCVHYLYSLLPLLTFHFVRLYRQTCEYKRKFPRQVLYIYLQTIRLIVNAARVINTDPDTNQYLSLFFLPDYSVSLAEILIPASDISQHISTAGTEASGTSNMKFCLNGGLLVGTVDGANIEIAEEVGEDNVCGSFSSTSRFQNTEG